MKMTITPRCREKQGKFRLVIRHGQTGGSSSDVIGAGNRAESQLARIQRQRPVVICPPLGVGSDVNRLSRNGCASLVESSKQVGKL